MAIDGFNIQNTDAIRHAECQDVPDLMIVAGPNGVGKSTLFEELRDLIQARTAHMNIEISNDTRQVYFSPHRAPSSAHINETSLTQMNETSFIENLSDPGYNIGGGTNLPNEIRRHGRRSRSVADYAPYFDVKRRLAQLKRERAYLVEDILDREGGVSEEQVPDVSEYIQSAINHLLPGLAYDRVEKQNNNYKVYFRNRTGDEVEFDQLSSGERDAIAMAFSLIEYEIEKDIAEARDEEYIHEDIVLLIDSPEAYLHPSLQARFLDYLREYDTKVNNEDWQLQVLMCTHSSVILDASSPDEVYFMVYPDQVEANQLVSAESVDKELLDVISGELGFAALSSGKPLLLVEGKSDKEILSQIHPGLEDNVEILPMGGKSTIQHLNRAFNDLIPELESMGVEVYAVLDRDRDWELDNQVEDNICVLPVTCIENLLLKNYTPLYNALDVLAGSSRLERVGIGEPSDVQDLVGDIINTAEFRDHELTKRLNEELSVHIDLRELPRITESNINNLIDEIADKNKERVDTHLKRIENRVDTAVASSDTDELDGKYILSQIASECEVRKDALARTTAERVRATNLPNRYNEFIEEIQTESGW
jgi:predicted ATPase